MAKYFLFADVLGFTNFVDNLSHDSLDERLSEWIRVINLIHKGTEVSRFDTVSDSILAATDDTNDGLSRLIVFARLLLEQGIQHSFPIRGAITRGDVTWGDSIYGKSVIEAIELEKSQDWIGISCQPDLSIDYSWDFTCVYPVPKKQGMIQLSPVVTWEIPQPEELFRLCFGREEWQQKKPIGWDSYSKFRNTVAFSSYIKSAKNRGSDPSKFDGSLGTF